MAEISDRVSTLPLVKTMVVVGREGEGSRVTSIYISGDDGYYNDLLRLGGGENVYAKQTSAFGSLSDEGMMKLNPDAIIEVSPPLDSGRATREEIVQSWKRLKRISAVKSGRILILDEDYTSIPGPRFTHLLRRIAEFLHPVEKMQ